MQPWGVMGKKLLFRWSRGIRVCIWNQGNFQNTTCYYTFTAPQCSSVRGNVHGWWVSWLSKPLAHVHFQAQDDDDMMVIAKGNWALKVISALTWSLTSEWFSNIKALSSHVPEHWSRDHRKKQFLPINPQSSIFTLLHIIKRFGICIKKCMEPHVQTFKILWYWHFKKFHGQ